MKTKKTLDRLIKLTGANNQASASMKTSEKDNGVIMGITDRDISARNSALTAVSLDRYEWAGIQQLRALRADKALQLVSDIVL